MGFFDKVKDALTTSDAEKAEKAKETADKAAKDYRQTADEARADYQKAAKEAKEKELEARQKAEELRRRAGTADDPTTAEDAAQSLLPAGFELLPATYAGGAVYAACRRSGMDGELPHPHHGQWGTTLPLAICGACLRAHAGLDQDRGSAGGERGAGLGDYTNPPRD